MSMDWNLITKYGCKETLLTELEGSLFLISHSSSRVNVHPLDSTICCITMHYTKFSTTIIDSRVAKYSSEAYH